MKYQKLRNGVTAKLRKSIGYRNLMLNEQSGAIFPASRYHIQEAAKEGRIYSELDAPFAFYQGDICVLNRVPLATYDLVPFGMTGKFVARQSDKSEFTYIFELFDRYEAFPGMRVSMIDSKPLEARLLADIKHNPERLKQFKTRVTEMKRVMFVVNRMDDKDISGLRSQWDWTKRQRMVISRRELLFKLISKPKLPDGWTKKLLPFYFFFWLSAYQSAKDHNKIFDNMIRFDKAALFRSLKVVE